MKLISVNVGQPRTVDWQGRMRADMVKRFLASGRSGFYVMVVREGVVQVGDEIKQLARAKQSVTVTDVRQLYASKHADPAILRRAVDLEALSDAWRGFLRDRLAQLEL